MKYIILVPDGAADEPIEKLDGRTPLEVAVTTNMDFMAQNGLCSLVQTIPQGMHPGSDVGNLALLGYNPKEVLTGRSPIEAANLGITLAEDEISFRCNLVTINDDVMVDYSAGHISTEQAHELIHALETHHGIDQVRFYPGTSYRHILVIKGPSVRKFMDIKCVAPHDISGQKITKYLPKGEGSALLLELMEIAQEVFEKHDVNFVRADLKENPANAIWLWGQGTSPKLELFNHKYGVDGSIISAVDLVNGIGRLAGLDVITVPGATGYFDTDYAAKANYAIASLKHKDFVYVHVEAPDEAGHLGSVKEKIRAIEQFDREVVGRILNHFDKSANVRILVSPDHPTPIAKKTHTNNPVPFIMYGSGIPFNGKEAYCEAAVADDDIYFGSGEEMVKYFMNKS